MPRRWVAVLLPLVATLAGMFSVAYSLRFAVDVFGARRRRDLPRMSHMNRRRWMRVPVELLVLIVLVVGISPALAVRADILQRCGARR